MPKSKPRKASAQGEIMTPSRVLDAIDNCLKDMARTYPQKTLEPEEIEHWHQDLSPFPVKAIEWAFDNWRRNGRFFPVYGDILDLCVAWAPAEKVGYTKCDAQCRERHRRGYGEVDVKILNELVVSKVKAADRLRQNRLTDAEIEEILDQVDKKRGYSPDWRKQRAL